MKKIVILLFISLCLSGCSADYDLVINNDLTVNETTILLDKNDVLHDNYSSIREGIMARINSYYYTSDFKKYTYELNYGSKLSGSTFTRKYNTIEDVFEGRFFNKLFKDGTYEIVGTKVIVKANLDSEDGIYMDNQPDPDFAVEYVNINIKVPYLITDGNYTSIDKNNNIITWKYTSSNIYDQLYFTFDTSKDINGEDVDSILIEDKESNMNIVYILGGIFVIILAGVSYIYIQYRKHNNI